MKGLKAQAQKELRYGLFRLRKGETVLLDDTHMHGQVFVPESGMATIPFRDWLASGDLLITGSTDVNMKTYDNGVVKVMGKYGMEELHLEPMFHFMLRESLETNDKRQLVGAEIGVHLGQNAEKILRCLNIKKLYLIDPYDANPEYPFAYAESRKEAIERLEPYNRKIEWVFRKSVDALPSLPPLDFCYHDSDHRRACVEAELPLGYALVKKGGVWGGHDYKNTAGNPECDVKTCVDQFFLEHNIPVLYYSPSMLNWWAVKE